MFEFVTLQVQPAARVLVSALAAMFIFYLRANRAQRYSGHIFSHHPPPLSMDLFPMMETILSLLWVLQVAYPGPVNRVAQVTILRKIRGNS